MSRRRWIAATALGLPLATVALLGVEVVLATRAEYLPDDPGYLVEAEVTPDGAAATGPVLRMVMLGDSTVAGLGAPTVEESLPVQTAQRVADRTGRPVAVRGLGISGARVASVTAEQIPLLRGDADVVVIVIGSNDVTHATPPWRFDDQVRAMLESAQQAAGEAPVVLGGIPLFGGATALAQPLRWVVGRYAEPLRGIQRDVAADAGVVFVNIAVEASPRFRGVPGAMSSDGFHPAPIGYGFWADALSDGVTRALNR